MAQHALSGGTFIRVPVQHWCEEIGERLCLNFIELVLLLENLLQRPEVQAVYVAQMALRVEVLPASLTCHG